MSKPNAWSFVSMYIFKLLVVLCCLPVSTLAQAEGANEGEGSGDCVAYDSSDVPIDILDNQSVTSTLIVADSFDVIDVNVSLDITHTFDADLNLTLISPSGTRVLLANRAGGDSQNYTGTVFDDASELCIENGVAPFTGDFHPQDSLMQLAGEAASGDWTLEIEDVASGDDGTLDSWSLSFCSIPDLPGTTCSDEEGEVACEGEGEGSAGTPVVIPDSELEALLRDSLPCPIDGPFLTDTDLQNIDAIYGEFSGISDLTGIEYCTNLTYLDLSHGYIRGDLSPLAGLSNLEYLDLEGNQINDLTPLSGLTSLTDLDLSTNQILDVSPLVGLVNLIRLDLSRNYICDLSPLLDNAGLDAGDEINVSVNPLAVGACGTVIPTLESLGVVVTSDTCANGGLEQCMLEVEVNIPDDALEAAIRMELAWTDPITNLVLFGLTKLRASSKSINNLSGMEYCVNLSELNLSNNKISNLTPLAELAVLTELDLSGNQVSDLTPLAGLGNLTTLSLKGNTICDLSPLLENPGLATGDELDVSANPLSVTACGVTLPALEAMGVEIQTNTCVGGGLAECLVEVAVNIPDPGLEFALRDELNKPDGPITNIDLYGLDSLFAYNNGISDLSGMEYCVNLTQLGIGFNNISDLTPLSHLDHLANLDLANNQISDLAPLSGLASLSRIDISDNLVCNMLPLVSIPSISFLIVGNNPLGYLSCEIGIPALTERSVTLVSLNCAGVGAESDCGAPYSAEMYVSPTGSDVNAGGIDTPFQSISRALLNLNLPHEELEATINLAPGGYAETVSLPAGTRLVGSGQGVTRIIPNRAAMDGQGNVAVLAGEDTSIESLSIVLPLDSADGARLLSIVDTSVTVREVELNGQFATDSIGVYVRGAASSDSLVTDCKIHQVEVAVDSAFSAARFAYNDILDIRGDAAIQIFQPTGATPILGNTDDLTTSGSNIFSNIENRFFKTLNVDETALAQANAWENLSNEAAILAQTQGALDVANPLYADTGKGLLGATVLVSVLEESTSCPVSGALVTLNANTRLTLVEAPGTPGVYVTSALPSGRYTVRVRAAGYADEAELLAANPGISGLTVQLSSNLGKALCSPEGEGEFDGSLEGEGEGRYVPENHTGDPNGDGQIDLSELLDVIALLNVGEYSCGTGQLVYRQGPAGGRQCLPHGADYEGVAPDWRISLSELLRMIQLYNMGGYYRCSGSQDGYCAGINQAPLLPAAR